MTMEVSVVVVSYNTRELTLRCLRALKEHLRPFAAEVWVVDNGSRDGSATAIVREFPEFRLLANARNRGFSAANNRALQMARGECFLLLNSDAFLQENALLRMLETLRSNPETAVVGPRLLHADGSLQLSCFRFPGPLKAVWEHLLLSAALPGSPIFGDYRAWAHDARREVDFVIGACWLVRRAAWQQIGGFDESFFLYSEETDWAKRAHAAGWKVVFEPSASAIHLGGESGKSRSARVFCEFHRGQERYIFKHHGRFGRGIYRAATVFGALLRALIFGAASLLFPRARRGFLGQVKAWKRIARWTLGRRGPGLQELP